MLSYFLPTLALCSYAFAIAALNIQYGKQKHLSGWIRTAESSALISHFAILAFSLIQKGGFAYINVLLVLGFVAWLLSLFAIIRRHKVDTIIFRPAVFGFAMLSIVLHYGIHDSHGVSGAMNTGVFMHIILSLLAFSLLALAALYACQILYLNRLLKRKNLKAFTPQLPSLLAVERDFFILLNTGTFLLSLALIVGVAFVEDMFAKHQLHKTSLSIAAWLLFSGIIALNHFKGMRGRPIVILTLVGSFILTLAYFGSRFVRDFLI